jgi:type IV pilus assembly protein PilM
MKWRTQYSSIGLDIGSHQVKMVQLKAAGQQWDLHHQATAALVQDSEAGPAASDEQIVRCLRSMLASGSFLGRQVVSALPGPEVDIRSVLLPASGEAQDLRNAIQKEAAAYLSYNVEDAVIEYLLTGEEQSGDRPKRRALVVSTPRQHVDHHLALLQNAGLYCVGLEVLPLALSRLLVQYQHVPTTSPLLMVDLGYRHSTACILWQQALMYNRTLSWGGALLTQAIMKELQLSADKAEQLKQQYGIDPQAASLPLVTQTSQRVNLQAMPGLLWELLRSQIETLAQELERILSYWGARFREALIDRLVLSGGSAALPGLEDYLRQRLGIDVMCIRPLDLADDTGTDPQTAAPSSWWHPVLAPATGLALRGRVSHG